jgi:hypothetical protein
MPVALLPLETETKVAPVFILGHYLTMTDGAGTPIRLCGP